MDDFAQLDHYELLGVNRNASTDEIKRAYRQQISRFHPDRFATASAEAQGYANRRALRINEAYATLSDFSARVAYSRSQTAGALATPERAHPTAPAVARDHLAELYDQARVHLAAGRRTQAATALREIQQLNPFYRDSADLLAHIETKVKPVRPPAPPKVPFAAAPDQGRRTLLVGGLGALVLAGLGAAGWVVRSWTAQASASRPADATAPPVEGTAEAVSVALASSPDATVASASSTSAPAPTTPPTVTRPVPSPTAEALAETGPLVYTEEFGTGLGWPSQSSASWSVGVTPDGYQVTARQGVGNIWAYRTSPAGTNFLVGVDLTVAGGLGGLLLRYSEPDRTYLACFINSASGSYRLERHDTDGTTVLVEVTHAAIKTGAGVSNRLLARLDGETVALRVNGQPLTELTIASPPATLKYGVVVVALAAEVVATFRNLTIRHL